MGKKCIVEMKEGERLYKTKLNALNEPVIREITCTPYTEPDTEAAYAHGYSNAEIKYRAEVKEAYQKGLSDAWHAARKISSMDSPTRDEVFGLVITSNIFDENTASEAIEKIQQHEQEKQFHIGEEIVTQNGFRGVVTGEDGKYVYFINGDGRDGCVETMMAAKTGRHFPEITEALQKMREE